MIFHTNQREAVLMKRTTLIRHEKTFADIKRVAAEERRTVSDVVDELLRTGLARYPDGKARKLPPLPTYSMGQARVDISDREALYDLMDGE